MIKLTNLINELEINKPKTSQEVYALWYKCVKARLSDSNFIEIFEQYGYILGDFVNKWLDSLKQPILNKIYNELKSKSGLNELNINNTRVTPEIVMDFIISIPKGDNFDEYYNMAEPIYNKYGWEGKKSSLSGWLEYLNIRDLGLLYIDLKKAFPNNINESQQITTQSILDYWDTKMQSRPKVDWNKFNQIKTKYFGKDKYVGLMDLEDNLDNHPLQPEQLVNLYSDLQQLFPKINVVTGSTLDELNVNNSRVTPEIVMDLYINNITTYNMELFNEYLHLCEPYCEKYDIDDSWIRTTDAFERFSNSDLLQFYRKMQSLIQKYSEKTVKKSTILQKMKNKFKLNELGINNYKVNRSEVLKYWIVYVKLSNHEYHKLRDEYSQKYLGHKLFKGTELIQQLPLPALTKFYYELKKIFGEPINELEINKPNKSAQDVIDLFINNSFKPDYLIRANQIFRKFGRDNYDNLSLMDWLKKLNPLKLNKIYTELETLGKYE